MKIIDPNYVPPQNTFKQWADGDYTFRGFEWTSKSNGRPILKAQSNGIMTGRLRWHLADGKEGPTQGLTLSDMAMLRRLVGLPQTRVPAEHEAGAVASFMEELQQAAQNKTIEAKIAKNWVNIKGLEVPQGYYRFFLSKITPLENGVPTPQPSEYGLRFFVEFTVESGEGGSPTPFKGATFSEIVSYAIEVVEGEATWKLGESGEPTGEATRLSTLFRLTAPQWSAQGLPSKDPYNLLPAWAAEALTAKKLLKGARGDNKNKRLALLWPTLEAVYEDQTYSTPVQPAIPAPSTNNSSFSSAKDVLTYVLDQLAGKPAVVDMGLTEAGKQLALQYFKPLKEQNQIQNTAYSSLTDEEVLTILEYISFQNNLKFADEYAKAAAIVRGEFTIINNEPEVPAPWEVEENPFK